MSFSLYMEAITIINNKQRLQNKNFTNNEMSIKDYLAIKVYKIINISYNNLNNSYCLKIFMFLSILIGSI